MENDTRPRHLGFKTKTRARPHITRKNYNKTIIFLLISSQKGVITSLFSLIFYCFDNYFELLLHKMKKKNKLTQNKGPFHSGCHKQSKFTAVLTESQMVLIKSWAHPVRGRVQTPPSPRGDREPMFSRLVSKPRPISRATAWVWDKSGLQSMTLVFKERHKPHKMFTDNNKPSKPKGGNCNSAIGVTFLYLEIIANGWVKFLRPTPLPPEIKTHSIRNTKKTEAPVVVEKCGAYRNKVKLLRLFSPQHFFFILFYFTAEWSRTEMRELQRNVVKDKNSHFKFAVKLARGFRAVCQNVTQGLKRPHM